MTSHNTDIETGRIPIREWSCQDRPREKFAARGASALSDAELIAILLRTGTATDSAVDLAKRLLASSGNQLNRLADSDLNQLTGVKGVGTAKATTLLAAFELCHRMLSERVTEAQQILTSYDVMNIMQDKIARLKHEEFWTIYLNQASKILKICQIGKGGLTTTAVDVRLIMQEAITSGATNLIVCHNHPSGSLRPSQKDLELTKQINQAAKLFNIHLTDHIILHKRSYFSFLEEGIL